MEKTLQQEIRQIVQEELDKERLSEKFDALNKKLNDLNKTTNDIMLTLVELNRSGK